MTGRVQGSATCDTSVLVAALTSWHPQHERARAQITERVRSVPAHVLLECYSVLTRLPAPHRIAPVHAGGVLDQVGLGTLALPDGEQRALARRLARAGVRGGASYDGLVGATALHHDLTLLTSDRRARTTYDALGVGYELV